MSLERDCEQAVIEMLSSNPDLKALGPLPRDRDASRGLPQLIVSATKGDHRLDGCQPFEVTVRVEIRANETDTAASRLDGWWTAIENAIDRAEGITRATLNRFKFLMFSLAESNDRTSEDDSRLRSREYQILAL